MSENFKGFTNSNDEKEVRLKIRNSEINRIIKDYKRLKKYQKSSLYEVQKLSGQETAIDKLVKEYGIDSEAIE
jgi:hypothetical protein